MNVITAFCRFKYSGFKRLVLLTGVLFLYTGWPSAFAGESENIKSVDYRPVVFVERKSLDESKNIIVDVLSKEPFINVQEEIVWSLGDADKSNADVKDEISVEPDLNWLTYLIGFLSMLIEALLWLFPLLIVYFLYTYRDYWLNLLNKKTTRNSNVILPDTLFGLDIKHGSLPVDIESAAHELWKAQKFREAVSLLYRGSLVSLFEQHRFTLPSGATEQDCIRFLELHFQKDHVDENSQIQARINRFRDITHAWTAIAYAHELPQENIFFEICNGWNAVFSNVHSEVNSVSAKPVMK